MRTTLSTPLVLAPLAVAVVAGLWVAFVNPGALGCYLWLLAILAGLFYFAPTGYRRGHPWQGTGAALLTVIAGPFSLLVLIPWARFGR